MQVLKQYGVLLVLGAVLVLATVAVMFNEASNEVDFAGRSGAWCNVSVLSIEGELDTTYTDTTIGSLEIARAIREFNTDDHDAVVILMDSGGGSAPAAEEISDALYDLQKPSVTFVRGAALSGAYWVSTASDYIISLPTSIVGNIGVTSSYLDETKLNETKGYTFQEIVSGTFKEVGNVNKPLTPEDRTYLQEHTDALFELFRQTVMRNRDMSPTDFEKVADAKFYLAADALELGLIDEIGGITSVKERLASELGVESKDLLFCEPHQYWE